MQLGVLLHLKVLSRQSVLGDSPTEGPCCMFRQAVHTAQMRHHWYSLLINKSWIKTYVVGSYRQSQLISHVYVMTTVEGALAVQMQMLYDPPPA